MKCIKFPNRDCDLLTCNTKQKCLWHGNESCPPPVGAEVGLENDYPLIPLDQITDEARMIAVRWIGVSELDFDIKEKHKLASDIMNYARRHPSPSAPVVAEQVLGLAEVDNKINVEAAMNGWRNAIAIDDIKITKL